MFKTKVWKLVGYGAKFPLLKFVSGLSVDIDECADDLDGCAHVCTDTYRSYKCSCKKGYHLSKDMHTCQGIANNTFHWTNLSVVC